MTWSMGWDCSTFATTSATELADNIYASYVGSGRPITAANVCDAYTFRGVVVRKQGDVGVEVGEHMESVVGTASASVLPPNCTTLWNKSTATGGRRGRGRAFIPIYAPGESTVDSLGVIPGVTVTATQALYDAFLIAAAGQGLFPQLFHQTAPFTPSPVLSFQMQSQIATQRRRMRR